MKPYQRNSFWHSKLQDYFKCPRFFRLKHIEGLQIEEARSGDLEFGTAVHLGIKDVLQGGDGMEIFGIYWDSIKPVDVDYGRMDWEALKNCGEVLLSKFARMHAKHYRPLMMEERLHGVLNGHPIEGTPDFVGYYKDIPVIVDWKTSAYRYPKERTISDQQMPLYLELVRQNADKFPEGFMPTHYMHQVFTKDRNAPAVQKALIFPLTDSVRFSTLDNVSETIADLTTRKTFPMNSGHCTRGVWVCPYFSKCFGEVKETQSE